VMGRRPRGRPRRSVRRTAAPAWSWIEPAGERDPQPVEDLADLVERERADLEHDQAVRRGLDEPGALRGDQLAILGAAREHLELAAGRRLGGWQVIRVCDRAPQ